MADCCSSHTDEIYGKNNRYYCNLVKFFTKICTHSYAACFHPFTRCNDKPPLFQAQYIIATPAAIAPAIPAFLIPAKIQHISFYCNKYNIYVHMLTFHTRRSKYCSARGSCGYCIQAIISSPKPSQTYSSAGVHYHYHTK